MSEIEPESNKKTAKKSTSDAVVASGSSSSVSSGEKGSSSTTDKKDEFTTQSSALEDARLASSVKMGIEMWMKDDEKKPAVGYVQTAAETESKATKGVGQAVDTKLLRNTATEPGQAGELKSLPVDGVPNAGKAGATKAADQDTKVKGAEPTEKSPAKIVSPETKIAAKVDEPKPAIKPVEQDLKVAAKVDEPKPAAKVVEHAAKVEPDYKAPTKVVEPVEKPEPGTKTVIVQNEGGSKVKGYDPNQKAVEVGDAAYQKPYEKQTIEVKPSDKQLPAEGKSRSFDGGTKELAPEINKQIGSEQKLSQAAFPPKVVDTGSGDKLKVTYTDKTDLGPINQVEYKKADPNVVNKAQVVDRADAVPVSKGEFKAQINTEAVPLNKADLIRKADALQQTDLGKPDYKTDITPLGKGEVIGGGVAYKKSDLIDMKVNDPLLNLEGNKAYKGSLPAEGIAKGEAIRGEAVRVDDGFKTAAMKQLDGNTSISNYKGDFKPESKIASPIDKSANIVYPAKMEQAGQAGPSKVTLSQVDGEGKLTAGKSAVPLSDVNAKSIHLNNLDAKNELHTPVPAKDVPVLPKQSTYNVFDDSNYGLKVPDKQAISPKVEGVNTQVGTKPEYVQPKTVASLDAFNKPLNFSPIKDAGAAASTVDKFPDGSKLGGSAMPINKIEAIGNAASKPAYPAYNEVGSLKQQGYDPNKVAAKGFEVAQPAYKGDLQIQKEKQLDAMTSVVKYNDKASTTDGANLTRLKSEIGTPTPDLVNKMRTDIVVSDKGINQKIGYDADLMKKQPGDYGKDLSKDFGLTKDIKEPVPGRPGEKPDYIKTQEGKYVDGLNKAIEGPNTKPELPNGPHKINEPTRFGDLNKQEPGKPGEPKPPADGLGKGNEGPNKINELPNKKIEQPNKIEGTNKTNEPPNKQIEQPSKVTEAPINKPSEVANKPAGPNKVNEVPNGPNGPNAPNGPNKITEIGPNGPNGPNKVTTESGTKTGDGRPGVVNNGTGKPADGVVQKPGGPINSGPINFTPPKGDPAVLRPPTDTGLKPPIARPEFNPPRTGDGTTVPRFGDATKLGDKPIVGRTTDGINPITGKFEGPRNPVTEYEQSIQRIRQLTAEGRNATDPMRLIDSILASAKDQPKQQLNKGQLAEADAAAKQKGEAIEAAKTGAKAKAEAAVKASQIELKGEAQVKVDAKRLLDSANQNGRNGDLKVDIINAGKLADAARKYVDGGKGSEHGGKLSAAEMIAAGKGDGQHGVKLPGDIAAGKIPLSGSIKVSDGLHPVKDLGHGETRAVSDLVKGQGLRGFGLSDAKMAAIAKGDGRLPVRGDYRYITGLELALIMSLAGIAKMRGNNAARLDGRIWGITRQGGRPVIFVDGRRSPFQINRGFGVRGDGSFRVRADGKSFRGMSTLTMKNADTSKLGTDGKAGATRLNMNLLGKYTYFNYFQARNGASDYYTSRGRAQGTMGLAFIMAASGMAKGNLGPGMDQQPRDKFNLNQTGPADRIKMNAMQGGSLITQAGHFNLDGTTNGDGKKGDKQDRPDKKEETSLGELADFLARLDEYAKKKDDTDETAEGPSISKVKLSDAISQMFREEMDEEDAEDAEDDSTSNAATPLNPVLRRPRWVVQVGQTLDGIAEATFGNSDYGWLIADLNKKVMRETYADGRRICEINSRQEIELPVHQDIEKFNKQRKKGQNAENLITIIIERQIEKEVVDSVLKKVIGAEA